MLTHSINTCEHKQSTILPHTFKEAKVKIKSETVGLFIGRTNLDMKINDLVPNTDIIKVQNQPCRVPKLKELTLVGLY